MQQKLLQSSKYMGKVWSMNTMAGIWYTRSELAAKMGMSAENVRQMELKGKIEPQGKTASGKNLYADWYVEKIVSDRQRRK